MSSSMTFGDYNRPDPMHSDSPIDLGVFKGYDFGVDPEFIMSFDRYAFHGLESEDVIGYLKTFDHLCGLVRRKGVPKETIKLLLFPFCLKEGAWKWLYSHPPNTFSSWNDLAQAFLHKYFPPSKTFKFRHDILTFRQGEFEGFSESWERFKELLSACPHHRIPSWLTTLTFFQNLLPYNRDLIIMASGGNFDDLNVKEGYDLIERMARADEDWGFDRVIPRRGPQVRGNPDIHSLHDDLTNTVDLLLLDDVHTVQSQHVPFIPLDMCCDDDFLSTCGSCGGVRNTFHVCPSYAYSPPSLNSNVMNDVNVMLPSNEHLSHYSSPISPLKDQLTPQNANLKLSSNGSELEFMRFDDNYEFDDDYGLLDTNCSLVESDLSDLYLIDLECVAFDENLKNVICVDDGVIEESSHKEYEVIDEPYDEECVGITCDSLEMNWNENFVLEEIELHTPCLEDICIPNLDIIVDNLDGEWDVVDDFEEPILEKFKVLYDVEDEPLTSIDCLDLISLTPLFEVMVIDDDCESSLMESFRNGYMNITPSESLGDSDILSDFRCCIPPLVSLKSSDNSLCDDEVLGVHFLPHKPPLLVSWFHGWLCLIRKIYYDHSLEDWSSSFDKLMRSLMGFLNDFTCILIWHLHIYLENLKKIKNMLFI